MSNFNNQNGSLTNPNQPYMPPVPPNNSYTNQPYMPPVPPSREQRLRSVVQKHEINRFFSDKMQLLQSYKFVFVFDDSGSMKTTLNDTPLNNQNSFFKATR